jgi:hypothetical protein
MSDVAASMLSSGSYENQPFRDSPEPATSAREKASRVRRSMI